MWPLPEGRVSRGFASAGSCSRYAPAAAPSTTAISPAMVAVSSFCVLPIASSTAFNRIGCAATALTTTRLRRYARQTA